MLIRVLFRWLNNIFFEFWPMKKSKSVTFEGLSGSGCYVGSRKFCNRGYYEPLFRDTAIYSQPDKDLQMWNELCNSKKKIQTGREEYNTKYRFVFTRKGPDRITRTIVTQTQCLLLTQYACQTCFDLPCVDRIVGSVWSALMWLVKAVLRAFFMCVCVCFGG